MKIVRLTANPYGRQQTRGFRPDDCCLSYGFAVRGLGQAPYQCTLVRGGFAVDFFVNSMER
ncbi:MAG: hypothetical protein IJ828_03610 [Treponema sp.]|nr:hypothetical protein [Treponema sp.]